ncbi:type VI secretion system baseplate subunit TssE [Massilia niabensis]|uniref:Type VI secretion system baseplate subunit TssE n=1 Tax=Massilia niabensis TaxID=544910 RepID=A0ABW0L3J0_9BURK
MKGFTPGLFDRLLGAPTRTGSAASGGSGAAGVASAASRMSIEEMKDAVARDLEALLNTRMVLPEGLLKGYPECSNSLVSYGMNDFADLSLSSPADRAYICGCIESTIACHEPRLRNVKAALEMREGAVNRLDFSITGLLVLNSAQESVNFDAVLQPSTLSYSINKAGRPAPAGA